MHIYMLSPFPISHSQYVCMWICVCVIAYVWEVQAKELAQAQQQLRQLRQQVFFIT